MGLFSENVATDFDFVDEPVVQCDIPVVKNTFLGDGDKQIIITNTF